MVKYLPLVWSGIWRKPGRTVLAGIQIIAAFALFGLLQGFATAVKEGVNKLDADVLWVHSRGSYSPLPLSHYEKIKAIPGVSLVSYSSYVPARYQDPKQQLLLIIAEPHDWAQMTRDVKIDPAYVEALARTRTGAIVGMALVRKYGWKIGQRIALQTDALKKDGSSTWAFDIVGTLEHTDPARRDQSTIILINFSYYDEARATGNGMAQQYVVRISDPTQAGEVADAIDARFANSPYETRSESWREMAQAQLRSLGNLDFTVRAILAAVLLSLLISIAAALVQTARERTPELAVLKTVGFSSAGVSTLLLAEAGVLCLGMAAAGLELAQALLWVAGRFNLLNGHPSVPNSVLAGGGVLAVLLALCSSLLPAWRGLRLQVAPALAGR